MSIVKTLETINFQATRLELTFLNVTHPANKYGHLEVITWRGSDGAAYFNSSSTIFEDLGNMKQIIQLYKQASPTDTTCNQLYFQTTVDMCKTVSGILRSHFLRGFLDGFLKSSDHLPGKYFFCFNVPTAVCNSRLITGCTMTKGVYQATNFTFNDMLFKSIRNDVKFRVMFKFMAYKKDNKTLVRLYTVNAGGAFQQTLNKKPREA